MVTLHFSASINKIKPFFFFLHVNKNNYLPFLSFNCYKGNTRCDPEANTGGSKGKEFTVFSALLAALKSLNFFSKNDSVPNNAMCLMYVWIDSGCDVKVILKSTWHPVKMFYRSTT